MTSTATNFRGHFLIAIPADVGGRASTGSSEVARDAPVAPPLRFGRESCGVAKATTGDTHSSVITSNDFAGAIDYATNVSTYNDGTNPAHNQQQVVAALSIPKH